MYNCIHNWCPEMKNIDIFEEIFSLSILFASVVNRVKIDTDAPCFSQ